MVQWLNQHAHRPIFATVMNLRNVYSCHILIRCHLTGKTTTPSWLLLFSPHVNIGLVLSLSGVLPGRSNVDAALVGPTGEDTRPPPGLTIFTPISSLVLTDGAVDLGILSSELIGVQLVVLISDIGLLVVVKHSVSEDNVTPLSVWRDNRLEQERDSRNRFHVFMFDTVRCIPNKRAPNRVKRVEYKVIYIFK